MLNRHLKDVANRLPKINDLENKISPKTANKLILPLFHLKKQRTMGVLLKLI